MMRTLAVLFSLLISLQSYADTLIGFRWGQVKDDHILTSLAKPLSSGVYRLTEANIRNAVEFDASNGWKKPSGSGIYISSDPADSFGDGRYELFIFEIHTSSQSNLKIKIGPLGEQVTDYYLNAGPRPPMMSRYNPTWFVIATAPNDQEFAHTQILFHRASAADVDKVWSYLKHPHPLGQFKGGSYMTNRYRTRLSEGLPIPADTHAFIQGMIQKAALEP